MIFFEKACVVAALAAVALGCDQRSFSVPTCAGTSIPSNACPVLEDDSECADPCCAAAYSCNDGTWTLEHACASYDDGAHCPDSSPPAVPEASVCDAEGLDAPAGSNGGPGCIDLQPPDCPLGEVLACGLSCAALGCESLFYCQDGEWINWGECTDGGPEPVP